MSLIDQLNNKVLYDEKGQYTIYLDSADLAKNSVNVNITDWHARVTTKFPITILEGLNAGPALYSKLLREYEQGKYKTAVLSVPQKLGATTGGTHFKFNNDPKKGINYNNTWVDVNGNPVQPRKLGATRGVNTFFSLGKPERNVEADGRRQAINKAAYKPADYTGEDRYITGATTGRLSCSDPNTAQIKKKKGGIGSTLSGLRCPTPENLVLDAGKVNFYEGSTPFDLEELEKIKNVFADYTFDSMHTAKLKELRELTEKYFLEGKQVTY